jgi:RTX calcium-binding nonapeptide repeat (4 copies)/WD40-like Beta Propeller Repeat
MDVRDASLLQREADDATGVLKEEGLEVVLRSVVALLTLGAIAVIPLGSAVASATTAKAIVYVSGGNLWTIGANGTGTTSLGETANNPSFSSDGQTIVFDDTASIRSISASGPANSSSVLCPGTNPAISPDKTKLAYVLGGSVRVSDLSCAGAIDFGTGSDPAWAPDGTQIAFVDSDGDIAVAPASGGAPQKLGTTAAVESSPSWSPDGSKIAYISDGELFVMDADGTKRQQLTSNTVAESSPSWAPGGDEIVYAASNHLYAITADGSSTRLLSDASDASQLDWGLAAANTANPTITPQAGAPYADGTELSASQGGWISVSGISSFAYQWKRCSSAGTGCTNIAGATSGTYMLASADIGGTVRVAVTATTPDGSAPGTSAATPVISAAPPGNTTPPTISGNAVVGETLTASAGTWTGSNPVFTYQWQKCDANGSAASCSNISSATATAYVPVNGDVGSTLRVLVTATNSLGATTKESGTTPVVASTKPVNTALPAVVENLASDGTVSSYSATTGTWTGAATITYLYQWRRCDSNGANCTDIAGATNTTYTPTSLDIGSRLRVAVTATNSYGTATAVSEPARVLAGTPPVSTIRPTISGTETSSSVLVATNGTWTGSAPLTYTFEWRRCNATGGSCVAIAGATAQSYVIQVSDVGSTIVIAVTARNAAASATVVSAPTGVIRARTPTATEPTVTVLPSFTGVLAKGQTLRANPGLWSGTTPMTFSYRWQRCPPTDSTCTAIPSATRSTYQLTTADVGKRIRLLVTAANAAGSTDSLSSISQRVAAKAPGKGRTIKGTARTDRLTGSPRPDTIHGGGGNDRIDGAAGDDKLYGDAGSDTIIGGAGRDAIFGGTGNDTIRADDGELDNIDCGPGKDTVVADKLDKVKGREKVARRGA